MAIIPITSKAKIRSLSLWTTLLLGRVRLGVVVLTAVYNFSNLAIYGRLYLPLHRAAWMSALVVAPYELTPFHLLLPIFLPVVAIK